MYIIMTADLDYDEMYKIVLVGDPGVGKTNLLAYFQANESAQRPGPDGAAATFKKARKPTVGTTTNCIFLIRFFADDLPSTNVSLHRS